MKLIRSLEHLAAKTARAAWPAVQYYNARFERPSVHPEWAPAPLLKRRERTFPQLGWPRTTDSLCPRCVKEVRTSIFDGTRSLSELIEGKPGEIKAEILEEDGKIVMKKTCEKHGSFTDVMAIDPQWLQRIERLYPGRDFKAPPTPLRQHGTSSAGDGTAEPEQHHRHGQAPARSRSPIVAVMVSEHTERRGQAGRTRRRWADRSS